MSEITELWRELLDEAVTSRIGDSIIRRRVVPEKRPNVFLAIAAEDGTPMLLLDVDPASVPQADRLPVGEGFTLTMARLTEGDEDRVSLVLRLAEPRYREVFAILVEDVVSVVVRQIDDQQMVQALLARLLFWQHFLAAHGPEGLGRQAQEGLYGEVWFLRACLLPNVDDFLAVESWTGPSGAVQDFQLPSCAVEVKTTSALQPQNLRIANERQLDDSGLPALWLFYLALEVSRTAGESLPEMVASVRRAVDSNESTRQCFDDHLWNAGYLDAHAELYRNIRYTVREHGCFRVHNGFPRIVEQDLRAGVGAVSYSISLGEARRFAAPENELVGNLRRK